MENPAELFEAISHPTRIKILKLLENEPSTFASLKRQLGISSSGNLDHHIKKLGQLIDIQRDGLYGLTDTGKEALASVGAVEAWKETERRKLKKFTKLPKEVTWLVVLASTVAVASFLVLRFIDFGRYQWPFFLEVLGMAFLLGSLSAIGMVKRKSWSWSLVVVQAILFLCFVVPALCYTTDILINLESINAAQSYLQQHQLHDLHSYEPIPGLLRKWVGFIVIVTVEGSVLYVALKQNVRKFFGMQNLTGHQKRVLVAGILVMVFGMLEFSSGVYHPSVRGFTQFQGFVIGFVVFLGGIAILMQKYLLGGLLTLGFSFFPTAYLLSIWPLAIAPKTGLPFYQIIIVTSAILILGMPIIALLLIRSNLKPAFIDFFGNIWRSLMR